MLSCSDAFGGLDAWNQTQIDISYISPQSVNRSIADTVHFETVLMLVTRRTLIDHQY